MKTILILEDNARELERLVKIVKRMDSEIVVECASDLKQAYHIAMNYPIDIFLVDIILEPRVSGDVSGVKFAENIRGMEKYRFTPIIFTTSLEDPNLYAYSDIHCYSYLEKPYDEEKVCTVIREALQVPTAESKSENIYYKSGGSLHKLCKDEIMYIENSRRGRIIHTIKESRIMPYKPCRDILAELDSDKFIQCSRYVIINKNYVDTVDIVNRYVSLKGLSESIEIGRAYKKSFMRDVLQ